MNRLELGETPISNVGPIVIDKHYIKNDLLKTAPGLIHVLPNSGKDIACEDLVFGPRLTETELSCRNNDN